MDFGVQGKKTVQSRFVEGVSTEEHDKRSRIQFSPLKNPLESAINKVVTTFGKETLSFGDKKRTGAVSPGRFGSTPRSRLMNNSSSSRNINNFSVENYDEDKDALEKMHSEPMEFLKKYFSGYSASNVPSPAFVDFLSKEFSSLWTESQAQAIFPEFSQKLMDRLGHEYISMPRLYQLTKENGLIGLILGILKELKNEQEMFEQGKKSTTSEPAFQAPSSRYFSESVSSSPQLQNVKNIIQQFTEGLYKATENQIYAKLNGEMRRLVLKYKEAESVLKTINDRINEDIDKIHYSRKKTQLERTHDLAIQKLNEKVRALQADLTRQRMANATLKAENDKYSVENRRLADTVDRFQNHMLKKGEEEIKYEVDRHRTTTVNCIPPNAQYVNFAYQSPKPSANTHIIGKAIPKTVIDKENIISVNSGSVVRATTPIKVRPSASPNRLLRVPRS